MKLRFDQTGGYAGLVKGCEIDTSTLPPEAAIEVERLVEKSALSSGEFLSKSSRDLHQYELTIEDGSSTTSVVLDDENVPPSAKPLIGYLKKCAKPKPLD